LQATSIKKLLHEISRTSFTINTLLQGFMSLGLVVGIAALGVISTRAVVERRHEIGILRAIGFKRSGVQAAFCWSRPLWLSWALSSARSGPRVLIPGAERHAGHHREPEVPDALVELAVVAGVAWVASMLMTIIPAWQASKIYPAEALRYE